MFKDIVAFHEKFGIKPLNNRFRADMMEFRKRFLREELTEFEAAVQDGNAHEALDALVDLAYVALGTAYIMGFKFDRAWDLVHAANMQKIRAESEDQSKRGSSFDVVKPAGWTAPDLKECL